VTETEPDPTHGTAPTRDEQEREVERAREEQRGGDPHGDLSNPARDPDPTEHPDPYDKRRDPRSPEEPDPAPASPSSSDPPPPRNIDRARYEGDER
jgi:hypothetical protein